MKNLVEQALDIRDALKPYRPRQRETEKYERMFVGLCVGALEFMEYLDEVEQPATAVTVRRRDQDGWVIIIKREGGEHGEVLFSGGADFVDCFLNVSKKIRRSDWKEDTPYKPPRNKK